jgi:emfourin
MLIRFDRAGGFAGPAMRRSCTVDTDTLPTEEAKELRTLLNTTDIPGLAAQPAGAQARARPDAFHYRLIVEEAGRQHTLEVSDADMPPSLRPLVHWLLQRASPGGT